MIWSAARLFHGRKVLWVAQSAGAVLWLLGSLSSDFVQWGSGRVILSCLIIASYTFLTAAELWRERRRSLLRRWPAIFVPMLHGAIFLFPIPLAALLPAQGGVLSLATGWVAVFALEMILYAVGTAFLVLVLAKERTVRIHRDAASMDSLTGALNRRGFFDAAERLIARAAARGEFVSVLAFDLDHFKSINDRFGHAVGDETLRAFAATTAKHMRSGDIVGRLGGEEFVAIIPGTVNDGIAAAERVQVAFLIDGQTISGQRIGATVSIGVASAPALNLNLPALMASADAALYRAKAAGRNRVEAAPQIDAPPLAPTEVNGAPAPAPAAI
jgi:diguanylate cyclase (GGDEF)-like protein